MAKLSASTEHALSVVAHALMAKGIGINVKGMGDFYEFYLKEQTAKDREIVKAFLKLSEQAKKDFAAMITKDMEARNG